MANTGYDWEANWTVLDAAIALTEGAQEDDLSDEIDCDGKAAIMVSVDSDYSDDAKATGGLVIYILRDIDDTVYEDSEAAGIQFEMPFVQNGTRRKVITISCAHIQKFKLYQVWTNSTGGSVVTSATAYKFATIPVAS